jgi:hypothetical protein
MRSEAFTALGMKMVVFCVAALRSPVTSTKLQGVTTQKTTDFIIVYELPGHPVL